MKPSAYFDSKVEARSALVGSSDCASDQTVSLETQADLCFQGLDALLGEDLGSYVVYIHKLDPKDQDIIFMYYGLKKDQSAIARKFGTNQSTISSELRMAVLRLGAVVNFGTPTVESMQVILEMVDRVKFLSNLTYAELIDIYSKHGSKSKIEELTGQKITIVRRSLEDLSVMLIASKYSDAKALGAYVFGLVKTASVYHKKGNREGHSPEPSCKDHRDPEIVGKEIIEFKDKDFDQVFMVPSARSLTGDLAAPPRAARKPAVASKMLPQGKAKAKVGTRDHEVEPNDATPIPSVANELPNPSVALRSPSDSAPTLSFGDRLRQLRDAWGLNQGELAKKIKSNQKSISHWEQQRHSPRRAVLDTLVEFTGITREAWQTGVGFVIPEKSHGDLGEPTNSHHRWVAVVAESLPPGLIGVLDLDRPGVAQDSIPADDASERMIKEHRGGRKVWIVVSSS